MTESNDIPPPPEDEPTPTFPVPPGGPDAGTRTYFASPPELSTRPAWGLADGGADSLPTIPEFELIDQIGYGGMGVVYKARQIKLDRTVALKVIRHDVPRDPDGSVSRRWKDRFEQEAKSLARLQHPNIVQIHDAGEANGRPYLVMEYVGGGMLDSRLRDATLPTPATTAEIVRTLARAVQVAHEQHVVHRDLKPANVLITPEGVLKIADFGLARLLDETNVGTGRESVAGTPGYMAPEQVRGEPVTPLVDVYALGAILYKLLVNRPPFSSDSKSKLMRMVCEEIPAPPRTLQAGVPADLEAICLRCIEKEPAKRYKSAKDVADDLDRYLRGEPTIARPVGWMKRRWMWAKRRPTTAALAVVAGLLLIAGATIGVISIRNVVLTEVARRAEAERETEQTRRESAEQIAEMNQISAQLFTAEQQAPAASVVAVPGWRERTIRELHKFASSTTAINFRDRLRGLYAAAETRIDLEEVGVLASDIGLDCLVISPDGKIVAGGENHGTGGAFLHVYVGTERYSHRIIDGFRPNSNGIRALAFSHNSRWLAIGSRGGKVLLLDTSTPAIQPRELTPSHKDQVKGLGFTRDNTKLVSVSFDDTIAVWTVTTGHRVKSQTCQQAHRPLGIAFSPTEERFVVCTVSGGFAYYSTSLDANEKLEPHTDFGVIKPYQCCLFSPNGSTLALASHGDLHINGVHINYPIQECRDYPLDKAHTSDVTGISINHAGTLLVTGSHDNYLKLWDATTGRLLLRVVMPGNGGVIPVFNPVTGELLVFANRRITRYRVILPDTVNVVGAHEAQVGAVAFAGNSSTVVSVAWHGMPGFFIGEQTIWNLTTLQPLKRIPYNRLPDGSPGYSSITVAPGSRTIVCSGKPDTDYEIWNWSTDPAVQTVQIARPRMGMKSQLRFSPDGNALWGIEPKTGNPKADYVRCVSWPDQQDLLTGADQISAIASSRAGLTCLDVGRTWAAVGSNDCTVKLIPTADPKGPWKPLHTGADNPVHSVALSPDESLVLAGTRSGQIRAFRLPGGTPLVTPQLHHLDRVEALAFTPNGQLLASGGRDNTIRLWKRDGAAFQAVVTYPTTGPVTQVTFSPDGSRLAFVVEGQRAFNVWDITQFRTKLREYNLDW